MRISIRLPCEWQLTDTQPSQADLLEMFSVHRSASLSTHIQQLDKDLRSLLPGMESPYKEAITLLAQKTDLLWQQLAFDGPTEPTSVVISHTGIDVCPDTGNAPAHPAATECTPYAGVHFVLPDGSHILTAAEVTRNDERVGMAFKDMPDNVAKTLSRFILNSRAA